MFNPQLQRVEAVPGAADFHLRLLCKPWRVFFHQQPQRAALLRVFGQNPRPAKHDHAAVVGCELFRHRLIFGNDAKRGFVIARDGVQLVPGSRHVKVQPALRINIAQRDSIGVALIPRDRQHTRAAAFQYPERLSLRKLLRLSPHWSEHTCSSSGKSDMGLRAPRSV